MAETPRICDYCKEEIEDEVVVAFGKNWHPQHFLCAHCKKPLKEGRYIEEGGKPYCETDWTTLFSKPKVHKCAKCNQVIKGTTVHALGKTWHKEHFVCAQCKRPFNDAPFYTKNGKPYCITDFNKLFPNQEPEGRQVCAKCNEPIVDNEVKALGKYWHKEHFVCEHCNKPIGEKEFFIKNGKPYCETDFNSLFPNEAHQEPKRNHTCAKCNKPITGVVVNAMGKSWHKDHFVCEHCKKPLGESKFIVEDGKPYCEADYYKLFSRSNEDQSDRKVCAKCNKLITGSALNAMGKSWHKDHFVCVHCKKPLGESKFIVEDGKPYCETDHHKLFSSRSNEDHGGHEVCAKCNKPITDPAVHALGKSWHKDHFVCEHCKKPLGDSQYVAKDGKPYCKSDYSLLFHKKDKAGHHICAKCDKPITDIVVKALDQYWHKEHFVCEHCGKPIPGSDFHAKDGKPYCEKDYGDLFGQRCTKCGDTFKDTVLFALQRNWHKHCFTCRECGASLVSQQYTVKSGHPCCIRCSVS